MKKLGIIFSSYNTTEYNQKSLRPWLNKENVAIAACSFRFEGFSNEDNIENINQLVAIATVNNNLTVFCDKTAVLKEHEARNKGLEHLLREDCDVIMLLDSDEFYTEEEVNFVLETINSPDFDKNAWYKIHFKNYIIDGKQWIDGFCPPRLFNRYFREYELKEFYWDNDVLYKVDNAYIDATVDYKKMPYAEINKDKLHVHHESWVGKRGIDKIKYQNSHFGRCSFKVTEDGKSIELNPKYYELTGEEMPTIHYDD